MLFHFPGHWKNTCAILIEFRYGSHFEDSRIRGITHFAEHLMFCSTQEFTAPELEKFIFNSTYSIEATTSREAVRLFAYFHKNKTEDVLHLFSQMLHSWECPPEALSTEKEKILKELEEFEQSEDNLLMNDINRITGMNSPCPIGTKTFIKNVSKNTLAQAKQHWIDNVLSAATQITAIGPMSKQALSSLESMFDDSHSLKTIDRWESSSFMFKIDKTISGCIFKQTTFHPLVILLDRIFYWRWQNSDAFHRYKLFSLGEMVGFFLVDNSLDKEEVRRFFFAPIQDEEFSFMMRNLCEFFDAMIDLIDVKEVLHWFNGFNEENYGLWNIHNPMEAHAYLKSITLEQLQAFHQLVIKE